MSRSDAPLEIDVRDLLDLAKDAGRVDPLLRLGGGSAGAAAQTFSDAGAVVRSGYVALDILLTQGVDAAEALASLEAAGMTGVAISGRAAGGWIDADAVTALAAVAAVQFARPTYGVAQTGAVGEEGSLAINADAARADFNVDGTGVAVGVLSDSFNDLGGAAADRASGDLPTVQVLEDSAGTDEGRAMLQIVHDVAPGADLLFHTANGGQANFAQGVRDLADAGADVIVDDIVYLAEPFFQDGLVARAVDAVFDQGVAYFSSAGNSARDSYEAFFNGSGDSLVLQGRNGPVDFGEMHDFDLTAGEDVRQRISIPQGGDVFLTFQWDQPFASVSSGGRASASDMDILLFRSGRPLTAENLVAISAGANVGGDPVEVFRFVNDTSETRFDVVITHFAGPEPALMKYIDLGRAVILEHDTDSDTSFGHAPAAGGLGVGAAFWGFTPNNGRETPLLESFSSAGPATVLFDDAGVRLATPEVRFSPDVVGPDGTNNTFFGSDIGFDADAAPNFFGTSAAAPHVAAAAALLLAANPTLTPSEIYDLLQSTAIDMGAAGFDVESGFGLVDAAAALAAADAPRNAEGGDGDDELSGGGQADVLKGRAGDDVLRGLGGDDLLIGGDGADALLGGADADVMDGGLGVDRLSGWRGDDTYIVGAGGVADVVIEKANNGVDLVRTRSDFVLPEHVENLSALARGLRLTGNDLDNLIVGSTVADVMIGLAGADDLKAGSGDDRLEGRAGDDILRGHAGDDHLFGARGDDILVGGLGADLMTGGGGDDTYRVDDAGDRAIETADNGFDSVQASVAFNLARNVEALILLGDSNLDGRGNSGDNRLTGNDGANILRAGAGADVLEGGDAGDTLIGHGGDDRLEGGAGDDLLLGKSENDVLIGGGGNDRMIGGDGADIFELTAAGGADRIDDFAAGTDKLRAAAFGFADGGDVLALATAVGADVRIDLPDGGAAVLIGVALSALTADDFLV